MTKVLVTRPMPGAIETSADVERLGLVPVLQPLTAIIACEKNNLPAHDMLIFTSANAVRVFARDYTGSADAICVGAKTAQIAKECGLNVILQGSGNADDLRGLINTYIPKDTGRLLHVRGAISASDALLGLRGDGYDFTDEIIYEITEADILPESVLSDLESGKISSVLFYSQNAARIFAKLVQNRDVSRVNAIAISQRAAEPVGKIGFAQIVIAKKPDHQSMMDALVTYNSK